MRPRAVRVQIRIAVGMLGLAALAWGNRLFGPGSWPQYSFWVDLALLVSAGALIVLACRPGYGFFRTSLNSLDEIRTVLKVTDKRRK
jgi:hypothetical protein